MAYHTALLPQRLRTAPPWGSGPVPSTGLPPSFGSLRPSTGGGLLPSPPGGAGGHPGGARVLTERRAALRGVARLFGAPESLGVPQGTALVQPHGFNLQSAEFDPAALKRPRLPTTGPSTAHGRPGGLLASTPGGAA
uniref:Uncharacterized protein n=1 Tax=Alexandrium monilatum TaxID=311494 RepID=A0A7S4QA92_9DINO